jgi:Raf kinase inhibitor-like YbhB/YbcL family protein
MQAWPKAALPLLLMSAMTFAQPAAPAGGSAAGGFTLSSTAFAPGAEIPEQYTCKGADISPPLEWSGAPAKAASFVLIMDDPDAPAGVWVHWVLWNVPRPAHSLPENIDKREQMDDGSRQGRNSFGKIGYNGPCPPGGQTHRYFFRLYALDEKLELATTASRAELDAAMKGHVLAQTEYMGTFHR